MRKLSKTDESVFVKFEKYLDPEFLNSEKFTDTLKDWIISRRQSGRKITSIAVPMICEDVNLYSTGAVIKAMKKSIKTSFPDLHIEHIPEYDFDKRQNKTSDKFSAIPHLRDLFSKNKIAGFVGYDEPEDVFFDEIYSPARLILKSLDKPIPLVDALFEMMLSFSKIYMNNQADKYVDNLAFTHNPRDIMSRYLEWLDNQVWMDNISIKVFDFQGVPFRSFRQKESRGNNDGRDILTGEWL